MLRSRAGRPSAFGSVRAQCRKSANGSSAPSHPPVARRWKASAAMAASGATRAEAACPAAALTIRLVPARTSASSSRACRSAGRAGARRASTPSPSAPRSPWRRRQTVPYRVPLSTDQRIVGRRVARGSSPVAPPACRQRSRPPARSVPIRLQRARRRRRRSSGASRAPASGPPPATAGRATAVRKRNRPTSSEAPRMWTQRIATARIHVMGSPPCVGPGHARS
jgi:hypothetical protein